MSWVAGAAGAVTVIAAIALWGWWVVRRIDAEEAAERLRAADLEWKPRATASHDERYYTKFAVMPPALTARTMSEASSFYPDPRRDPIVVLDLPWPMTAEEAKAFTTSRARWVGMSGTRVEFA